MSQLISCNSCSRTRAVLPRRSWLPPGWTRVSWIERQNSRGCMREVARQTIDLCPKCREDDVNGVIGAVLDSLESLDDPEHDDHPIPA